MRATVPSVAARLRRLVLSGALTVALVAALSPGSARAEAFGQGQRQVNGGAAKSSVTASSRSVGAKARQLYGVPRSGLPWHTGIWTGNGMSASRTIAAERWIGHRYDFTTVYPGYGTWAEMADSAWTITLMKGWTGRFAYGLPLLPNNRRGQWNDILSGKRDSVFRKIARDLKNGGRGDAAVRVGLEGNGNWFAWGATYSTAPQFRKAFQRVVRIMRKESPKLTFWFDTSSGFGLQGQHNRMDALKVLYPGDAYVDGISMDHYDFWELQAKNITAWNRSLKPVKGPGLLDAALFARAHKKGFAVPEWGVHGGSGVHAGGDNAFFVRKMHDFFLAFKDVLVFECYFNEPDSYIRNSIFSPVQMPKASAMYRKLF
jgi:hypothetical protein